MVEKYIVISNCADDNVVYDFGLDQEEVLELCECFYENCMVLNSDKCHYICLWKDVVSNLLQFFGKDIKASELEAGLGIEIVNKLNFESHIKIFAAKHPKN